MAKGSWKLFAVLAACAGFTLPVLAAQEHLDTLERECGAQLELSAAGCKCISDAAAAELNEVQQAFVAAQVTKNRAEIMRAQQQMTVNDTMLAGTFMTTAPSRCAGQ